MQMLEVMRRSFSSDGDHKVDESDDKMFFEEGDDGSHEGDRGEKWNKSAIEMKKLAKNTMNMLKTKANFEGDDVVAVMVDAIVNPKVMMLSTQCLHQ
ncbi:hypothetical protein PIB30_037987 [Stylosanthes scabra]|uniref:Uncharacterized protein n=1 Tax=Stylosanthes scabra TaxID=79078 RepID=A0ABU6ZCM0_9FABA|nr:hypothetical protein [Stylosanthes scabra]